MASFTIDLLATDGDDGFYKDVIRDIAKNLTYKIDPNTALGRKGASETGLLAGIRTLADNAADRIITAYDKTALEQGDDEPSYDVQVERTGAGARITISGEDVCFLEFGIGDDTSASPEEEVAKEFEGIDVRPKSWSENNGENGGPYYRHGFWHFSKLITKRYKYGGRMREKKFRLTKKYTGVPGSHAIYKAEKYIDENLQQTLDKAWRRA